MIICKKCGTQNPLGRVFCQSCGTKLDLSAMSTDVVSEAVKVNWFVKHWTKFAILLVAILLIPVFLSLWSVQGAIGEKGVRVKAKDAVERNLTLVTGLRAGQRVGPEFTEADINGYFENFENEKLKIDGFSVSIKKGLITARLLKSFFKIKAGEYIVPIGFSYEVSCVPSSGRLLVGEARLGHLPLVGGTKSIASGAILKTLAADERWAPLSKDIEDIKLVDGKITVVINRK